MVSGRGGYREGAGRKKKAEAYKGEPTTAVRIPTSVAEPLLALLEDGKQVTILEAGSQPNLQLSPEVEKLQGEILGLKEREADLVKQNNQLRSANLDKESQLSNITEQLVRLKDECKELREQIEAFTPSQPVSAQSDLEPEAVQGAVAALLEALSIPGNQSNRGKVAQALRLLGAEVPESKVRGKRQKS